VVGAAGTGMTWIIFMKEGSSVILFQNHGRIQSEMMERGIQSGQGGIFTPSSGSYTNFARRGALDIQVWQPSTKVKGHWKNSDIYININDFRLMLRRVLRNAHTRGKLSSMNCSSD